MDNKDEITKDFAFCSPRGKAMLQGQRYDLHFPFLWASA